MQFLLIFLSRNERRKVTSTFFFFSFWLLHFSKIFLMIKFRLELIHFICLDDQSFQYGTAGG